MYRPTTLLWQEAKPKNQTEEKKKGKKKGMFRTVLFFHNVSRGSVLMFRMNKDLFVLFVINSFRVQDAACQIGWVPKSH